jgi:copper ion binding protein
MVNETIHIKGMSCQHCVMNVSKAITMLDGISGADVEIGLLTVTYDESKVHRSDIESAIETAGYQVERTSG